jgi:hypothetical protein
MLLRVRAQGSMTSTTTLSLVPSLPVQLGERGEGEEVSEEEGDERTETR